MFYFRGYPHLHAFFNIAMDAENPLSVGEQVGVADKPIEGDDLVLVAVKARDLTAEFINTLGGIQITPERTYTIATNDYVADERLETDIGSGKTTGNLGLLRDALINHVRSNGLS